MRLKQLCKRIADRLGIEPLEIKFEEMIDDSRLYIKEEYVAINKKFENDYVECAKAIAHEYRHVFQLFFVHMFPGERAERWKKELNQAINSLNINETGSNYISQELELDAFAFTKLYLERYEAIPVRSKIEGFDEIIEKYLIINKNIL
ncbi:MAG: hypothetical protein PHO86_05460 [Bacilli bacterium]|nr:hypothetical protein [Bacilli bacterium]